MRRAILVIVALCVATALAVLPAAAAEKGKPARDRPAPIEVTSPPGKGEVVLPGRFTPVDPPGAPGAWPWAVNASGAVVGYYPESNSPLPAVHHGFLLKKGQYTKIDYPGAANTRAYGINDSGHIVGIWTDSNWWPYHGWLREPDGTFSTIAPPGSVDTDAYGINARGDIVGDYGDAEGSYHGFLLRGGVYTSYSYPDAPWTWFNAINDSGDITGGYWTDSIHAFLLHEGEWMEISPPGSVETYATGIDARGRVVGFYVEESGQAHGYMYDRGAYTVIDYPYPNSDPSDLANHTYLSGISSSGWVVGNWRDSQNPPGGPGTENQLAPYGFLMRLGKR